MCRYTMAQHIATLLGLGRALVDVYCGSFRHVPKRIVLKSSGGSGRPRPARGGRRGTG
jgi:hypothetical protein